ncbi:MAG: nucleotide sugar dehydrogenase [Phycisphaerales bacterium]|nr:nucleotide sugar dehydrogenase [Phycisphaerales bacterium]
MTPEVATSLKTKLDTNTALVAVIGLGYVGLPLAASLHTGGLPILGLDVDPGKIEALGRGENYLKHLGEQMTADLAASDRFEATNDFSRLNEADVILVCLPTPLGKHHEPDLSYVVVAGEQIGRTLRAGQLIVLESTTYPGTTRGEFLEAIEREAAKAGTNLTCGVDYFVAYSPEREDPGRQSHTTSTIPKLVGGLDDASADLAMQMYGKGIENLHRVDSAEIAEAAKLLENIFRAVNIAMVNEMKLILTRMGIDVWKVIEAASTKPFGFMPFYPGPGLGGHCIPIDPFYLTWKAREFGHVTRFIELAGEINHAMPGYVVDRLAEALNEHGKPVRGSNVLVLGLAYKPDVDDTRESPSFEVIEILRDRGAVVEYSDPHVPKSLPVRKHDLGMQSVDLTPESIARFDAVVVVTDHKGFDYGLIAQHAKLVVDTRNAMAPHADALGNRLVRA